MKTQTTEELDLLQIQAEAQGKKLKVEVIADSGGKWCGNTKRYDTVALAVKGAEDLADRWILVEKWRISIAED